MGQYFSRVFSRDESIHVKVIEGDIAGIQFLSKQGINLERKDEEDRTPLTVAVMDAARNDVAETLIELGADINAYCEGPNGGTPLHYAAREGHVNMVALLLSYGANAFVKNQERQTPLDVARKNRRHFVVREIESRVCYFSGQVREYFGPEVSDVPVPNPSSALIWVIVVPRSPNNPPTPQKLEFVIYSDLQDAEPRKILSLGSNVKKPKFDKPSPFLTIIEQKTGARYKFSAVNSDDKQQLRRLYHACKGISQVMRASSQLPASEALGSSIHTASQTNNPALRTPRTFSSPMTPTNNVRRGDHYGTGNWGATQQTPDRFPAPAAVGLPTPSAPPINNNNCSNDINEVSASPADTAAQPAAATSTLCVLCMGAPLEGACDPCGHVCACMSCLKKIEDRDRICPICRAKIEKVLKLYVIKNC